MSDSQKTAMASGRQHSAAVKRYLDALQANRPKRGRKRTPESIDKQLAAIDSKLAGATAFERLALVQQKSDLEAEKGRLGVAVDLSELESGFIASAAAYGASKGITYGTWRSVGVDADLLTKAGISRSGD